MKRKNEKLSFFQAKLKHSNNLQNFAINFSILVNFPKTFLHFRIASKHIMTYWKKVDEHKIHNKLEDQTSHTRGQCNCWEHIQSDQISTQLLALQPCPFAHSIYSHNSIEGMEMRHCFERSNQLSWFLLKRALPSEERRGPQNEGDTPTTFGVWEFDDINAWQIFGWKNDECRNAWQIFGWKNDDCSRINNRPGVTFTCPSQHVGRALLCMKVIPCRRNMYGYQLF